MLLAAAMNEISNDAPLKEGSDEAEVERRKDIFNDGMSLCRIYFYLSSETDFFFYFWISSLYRIISLQGELVGT